MAQHKSGLELQTELSLRYQKAELLASTQRGIRKFQSISEGYENDSFVYETTQLLLAFISAEGQVIAPQQEHFVGMEHFTWASLAGYTDFLSVVNHLLAHAIGHLQLLQMEAELPED